MVRDRGALVLPPLRNARLRRPSVVLAPKDVVYVQCRVRRVVDRSAAHPPQESVLRHDGLDHSACDLVPDETKINER
eukprot:1965491-Prymnesium_polylepis.1